MNIVCIIQARYSSTRLPGKILLPVINDKSVLELVIQRVNKSNLINKVIVATSTEQSDDILLNKDLDVTLFRGDLNNVFSRYYDCAKQYKADVIVRITGDCPCIDHNVIDQAIKSHLDNNNDYTSNAIKRTFPHGMDVEVFNFSCFDKIEKSEMTKQDLEHVTRFFYNNPDKFKLGNIVQSNELDTSDIRITVDEKNDYDLALIIFSLLGEDFLLEDINSLFSKLESLSKINSNVHQKKQFDNLEKELEYAIDICDDLELTRVSKILRESK
ncbi:MAG: cytidylyltransferase domain-containing protein [Anaerorhabdus sp.]